MSEFERRAELEDAFNDMHKMKAEVYRNYISKNFYKIRLVRNGKDVVLTEVMDNGLPKLVTLEYDGKVEQFKCMYDAEKEAVNILRG